MLQTSRDGKKRENTRREYKYSGTCILHSHYFGLHGWLQQDHNNIYQETLFTDEKSSLQQNRQLGSLPPWICPPSGMHHVIERIKGKVPPYQQLQHFACKCRRSSYIIDGYRLIYMIYIIYEYSILIIVVVVAVAMSIGKLYSNTPVFQVIYWRPWCIWT